jgi:glycogen(starch) synthase
MRLLLYSPAFLPHIGGLEIKVACLAEEFQRLGQEVVVISKTPNPQPDDFPFPVVRRPSSGELLRWARWCDVFFQFNVSLRGLWPLLLVRRSWVVSHQSWYRQADSRIAWQDRLKRFLLRWAAASISISPAIAEDLGTPSVIIANSYRDNLFRVIPGIERTGDLAFAGRLVSDKGVDLLLEAFARLTRQGLTPRLVVIGDGPEAPCLREQAQRLGIAERVDFLGTRTGEELVGLLNRHPILVVPSRYNEPFGIVALEGIACGCVVVGSEGGGLKDAIGLCGPTFRNGDVDNLTDVLKHLLQYPESRVEYRAHAEAHLARHASAHVAAAYLRTIEGAVRRSSA